jgi:hypothetical protein
MLDTPTLEARKESRKERERSIDLEIRFGPTAGDELYGGGKRSTMGVTKSKPNDVEAFKNDCTST